MELLKNEVHIWLTPVAQVPLELIAQYKRFMSLEEQDRNQRFRFEHSRRSDCVTRALIRTTLSHYYDKPFTDWAFIKGEHGKPEIDQSPIPLRFNVSHTSSHVICAVTREWDIGIDIENIDRKNNILDIADRFFSSIEVKQLFSMPKERQLDRFFDYWTLKESYMKARGEGISLGLGNFSFDIKGEEDIELSISSGIHDQPNAWRFWLFHPAVDHRLALAVKSQHGSPRLRFFHTIPLQSIKEGTAPSAHM